MTDKERVDFLIEWLKSLYTIKKDVPENKVVDEQISFVEFRLSQLGCNDYTKLR